MKLSFTEVWSFLKLMKGAEESWRLTLVAGNCVWENASHSLVQQLEDDSHYDVELLPNLFTFREIFWQPNVYPSLNACLTGLKLVANYSNELKEEHGNSDEETRKLYVHLVNHIGKLAEEAHEILSGGEQAGEQIPPVVGEFRKQSFPVIMLFIHHPMNRPAYREDALRRINFMVKTLLEQYQLRFNDLMLPYWEIERIGPGAVKTATQEGKGISEGPEMGSPS